MFYSYEQIEIMKLMQKEIVRKNRHIWGYFQSKKERASEGK
ncbi:hypothetical protein [Heyndrickxia camelliae]|nr:hypothetical protein [Heyndrickxia camelliae]